MSTSEIKLCHVSVKIGLSIAPLVAGAIGLGLAIWGTLFIARLIKHAAR